MRDHGRSCRKTDNNAPESEKRKTVPKLRVRELKGALICGDSFRYTHAGDGLLLIVRLDWNTECRMRMKHLFHFSRYISKPCFCLEFDAGGYSITSFHFDSK